MGRFLKGKVTKNVTKVPEKLKKQTSSNKKDVKQNDIGKSKRDLKRQLATKSKQMDSPKIQVKRARTRSNGPVDGCFRGVLMKELRQEGNQKALNQLQNNNNATVASDRLGQNLNADQPVVASAKRLIDSIKRRKVDADRKAVGSVTPKKPMEFYSEPPEPGTSSQEKSQPIEGDGIQVEVNDSDDGFLDNEHQKDVEHRSLSGSESDDGDVIDEEKNSSSEHKISSGEESEYLEKNYRRPQKSGKHNQKKQKVSSIVTCPLGH